MGDARCFQGAAALRRPNKKPTAVRNCRSLRLRNGQESFFAVRKQIVCTSPAQPLKTAHLPGPLPPNSPQHEIAFRPLFHFLGRPNFRSDFTYDGLSRMAKIVEKTGATINSTRKFVWS